MFSNLAGDHWTAEIETAWSDAYGIFAGAMLAGAEEASLEAAA